MPLETLEDLQKYETDTNSKIEALTVANAQYLEKLKSLQACIKSGAMGNMGNDGHALAIANRKFEECLKAGAHGIKGELTEADIQFLAANKEANKNGSRRFLLQKADLGTPLVNDTVTGSYVVPEEWHNEVSKLAAIVSEIIPVSTNMPMMSRVKYIPVKADGLTFQQIISDSGDNPEGNPTFGQKTLTSYTYAVWVGLTEALLEDDITGLGDYFRELIADAYVAIWEQEMLTGASAPTGLLANASTQSVVSGGPGFGDLKYDDFINLEGELSERKGALRGASFLMSPYTWNIVRGLQDAMGRYYVDPTLGAAKQILGYPARLSYELPDSSDSAINTKFIGFGNTRHLVYGDRIGLEVKFFDSTLYAVINCEVLLRFRFRGAFEIDLPAEFAILKTAPA